MLAQLNEAQFQSVIRAARLVRGEPVTETLDGVFTITHPEPPAVDRTGEMVYEFKTISTIEFDLDGTSITVGNEMLLFLGRYSRIDATESEVEPLIDAVVLRCDDDTLTAGVVQVRPRPDALTSLAASSPR